MDQLSLDVGILNKINITTELPSNISLLGFDRMQVVNLKLHLHDGQTLNIWGDLRSDVPLFKQKKLTQFEDNLVETATLDGDLYNMIERLWKCLQHVYSFDPFNFSITLFASELNQFKLGDESVILSVKQTKKTFFQYLVDYSIFAEQWSEVRFLIHSNFNLSTNPVMALHIMALAYPNMLLTPSETTISRKQILRNRNSGTEVSIKNIQQTTAEGDRSQQPCKATLTYHHDLFSAKVEVTQ